MHRIVPVSIALVSLGLSAGAALAQSLPAAPDKALEVYAQPQTLVALPGGRRLDLYCSGQGSPTVILEGGLTADLVNWRKVQEPLSAITRVCSYSRAGYRYSDEGPLPRTAQALADDLAGLLKAAKIEGPYVVVAHSLGALDARLFVDQHRSAVAGLVLVDPSMEYQDREMAKLAPTGAKAQAAFEAGFRICAEAVIAGKMTADLPQRPYCIHGPSQSPPGSVMAARVAWQLTAAYQRSVLSELTSLDGASSDQVAKSRRSWGDLSMIILTAENTTKDPTLPPTEQAAMTKGWWDMHQGVAELSTRGEHRLVRDTGHLIPDDRPQAIIDAVTSVIEGTRKTNAK